MSWIDRIQTDVTVTMGDGSKFTPKWQRAGDVLEFNVREFEFREVEGTLVRRKKAKGGRYAMEWFFDGEDHLDMREAFRESSKHPGAWTISHPYYNTLTVQPLGLAFDNDNLNVTRISGTVVETITEDGAKATTSAPDKITEDKAATDELFAESYGEEVQVKVADRQTLLGDASALYEKGVKAVKDTLDAEAYRNAFNTANSWVNNATADPLEVMRKMQALINAPALFADSVKSRLANLANQFESLRASILGTLTRNDKKAYESNGGTLISAMLLATVSNTTPTDYSNRAKAVEAIISLTAAYNGYLEDLDTLQTANAGSPTGYVPAAAPLIALGRLVSYTVAHLYNVAAGSRQERTVVLDADSNLVVVAHKYFGLLPDDSTLTELIEANDIALDEYLGLKKGRRITHYV